jgi:hypothetical protein
MDSKVNVDHVEALGDPFLFETENLTRFGDYNDIKRVKSLL